MHPCNSRFWTGLTLAVLAAALGVAGLAALGRVFAEQLPDYGEGTVLAMVERIRREPIERSWLEQEPYTLTSYGPAYYYALLGANRLLPWLKPSWPPSPASPSPAPARVPWWPPGPDRALPPGP